MFDMLDDDLQLDYVPTMLTNSRSGNMKKLTKKQPKAQPKPPPPKNNKASLNEYDDLLDEFDLDYKKTAKPAETKPPAAHKNMFNSLESEWDQPKSTSLQKKKAEPVVSNVSNVSKSPTFKFDHVDDIIHEEQSFNSFGKTQQAIPNTSKVEESFVSSRNMKPPMRKKNEQSNDSLSFGMGSVGLVIPQETNNNKTGGLKLDDEDIIRPPPRLMNRRSSVDGKSEKNDEPLSLPKNTRSESPINTLSLEIKKQDKPRETLKLSLDQPKIEPKVQPKKEKHIVKFTEKQQKPYESEIAKTEKIVVKEQKPKKGLDLHVDQSITILRDSPGVTVPNKIALQEYEKQLEQVKITFQKQIDFLQQNLDRQIAVNRETRDKLMRESNKMIEEQRVRTKKVHEQEMRRAKEMFEWQKRRMEESFQSQIQNLRQSLEYAQKNNNYTFKTGSSSRDDNEYMESQLKHQRKLLQDRERILEKRENDLSDRQLQYNKRKRKEEERLRDEEKRILQSQMKLKKQVMQQRRALNEQKQQMAMELANLQIQAMKRREKAEYGLKQNQIEKEGLQNERYQLRNQNAELMARYRAKAQEVQNEKQRLKLIEQDLIKKLRIVEQRMKQPQPQGATVNKTMYNKKENNWIEDRDRSHQNLRSYSIERDANRSVNANQTKERFYQLESNTKNKMNISAKENKKFDLDNYMMTVEEYKKMKGEA